VGFRYAWRVDPFDGGPHFTAPTDEVSLVQRTREGVVAKLLPPSETPKSHALVAHEPSEQPWFRCVETAWRPSGDAGVDLPRAAAEHLGIGEGAKVWVLPLE
jgi:arginine N-succinyltransferase